MNKSFLPTVARHGLRLILLVIGLSALSSMAQTSQFMTYQGFLTDGNGNPLGNTNTGPASYSVVFRIWNLPTGGVTNGPNELWAELQTVTVNAGYFSILLGQGTAYNAEPRGQLANVFTNSSATTYIEMTVLGIGTGGANVTLLPRLQFVYSPYAFVASAAGTANSLVNNGGAPLISSSSAGLNMPVQVNVNTLQVTNTLNVSGPINSAAINSTAISDSDGPGGAGGIYLNSTNGYHQSSFGQFVVDAPNVFGGRLMVKTNGFVGIDNPSPGANLDVLGLMQVNTNGTVESPGTRNTYNGMIEAYFAGPNDRYGMGQFPNGITALYTSAAYGSSSIQMGIMTGASSFQSQMTVAHNGNVGIGTTTPVTTLEVNGTEQIDNIGGMQIGTGAAGATSLAVQLSASSGGYATLQAIKNQGTAWGNICLNPSSGNVGVGTTSPTTAALVVAGYQSDSSSAGFGILSTGGAFTQSGIGSTPISIYASYAIWSGTYVFVASDARMKNIKGQSDGAADLRTLQGIQVTDYTFKDSKLKGSIPQKKVIAQQVEKVYPQAVSKHTDVVPDIYQTADLKDGWVQLATDLKVGERVKLIGTKEEGVHPVLEVRPGAFRTDFKSSTDKVFVYGREVNDFRTVDYDAIAMLNVSATQELARQQEAQSREIADLKQQVAELKRLFVAMSENGGNRKQPATPAAAPQNVTASLDR